LPQMSKPILEGKIPCPRICLLNCPPA